jgi:hypothetical protein
LHIVHFYFRKKYFLLWHKHLYQAEKNKQRDSKQQSECVRLSHQRARAESKNYHTRRIPVGESPARRSLSDSEHQLRASDEKIATGILAQHVVVVLIVLWGDRKRSRSHANPLSPDSPLDHSMHANRVSRRNMTQLKSAKQERDHEVDPWSLWMGS